MTIAGSLKKLFLNQKIDVNVKELSWSGQGTSLKPFKIVQISDLHINDWNIELIDRSIEVVNSLKPDLIVVTGDVICYGQKFIPDIIKFFNRLNASIGKYACLGNHDHSDGEDGKRIIAAYNRSDFRILVNESEIIKINGMDLHIAGADDFELGEQDIKKTVKKVPGNEKLILLVHNPINFRELVKYCPDLVLAGHTHGGQFSLPLWKYFYNMFSEIEFLAGMYQQDDSLLYVNRGLGTALFSPVIFNKKYHIKTPRINSNPEITVFTIKPEQT